VSFRAYLVAQLTAIALMSVFPEDSWQSVVIRVLVGWSAAVSVLLGIRRHRPAGAPAFGAFAFGIFVNVTGILVERILATLNPDDFPPTWADACWLAIYPALILGMALLIRRRGKTRDWSALVDTTIITVGLGLLSWVFLIRPQATHIDTTLFGRAVLTAYPVGDLVVLALMVRLLLGGGSRAPAFGLVVAALVSLLWADLVWALVSRQGAAPGPALGRLLAMNYQLAYALVGASALHPSVRDIAQPQERPQRLNAGLLVGLAVASLIAPGLLMFETARHHVVDGAAIATCSTVLFLLVVARMAALVRHLGERNRAIRLVLDTVNQGLLRVERDGTMAEERSAMVDQWIGAAPRGTRFADHVAPLDSGFAAAFRVGHDQWCEDVMPSELCLAQMPQRLRVAGRDLSVSYLPVADARRGPDSLLVVMDDVTERVQSLQHEAEQRELLAMLQGFARDRVDQARFFAEVTEQLTLLETPAIDAAAHRRLLHTLKGNAALTGLDVVAQLCHDAETALEEPEFAEPGSREAGRAAYLAALAKLAARWRVLTGALDQLAGDRDPDAVELRKREIDRLRTDVTRGLPTAQILDRLSDWRCEPVARPLGRLGRHAQALARRLGKGDLQVDIDGGDLRLDPERWNPLWAELVHVVNNAVDHGIEPAGERRAAGKPVRARVRLAAKLDEGALVITIDDDGRGIDWAAIRRTAIARGLAAETSDDLTAALLSAGVSTRDVVTLVSGRGVGLAAVDSRTRALGGTISIASQAGQGTTWRFSFPLARTLAGPAEDAAAASVNRAGQSGSGLA
jgi:HPt (histidine-containing phosphotransfer) domain-containing protein